MKKLLLLSALTLPLIACTEPNGQALNANLGGFTHHFKEKKGGGDWNQIHNNIGLEYEVNTKNKFRQFVSHEQFKNSFGDRGSLTAAGVKYCGIQKLCVPVGIGYFTGYKNTTYTPYAGIEYTPIEKVTLRMSVAPAHKEQGNNTGFAFIGFKINLLEW